jgi:hypothetical protein
MPPKLPPTMATAGALGDHVRTAALTRSLPHQHGAPDHPLRMGPAVARTAPHRHARSGSVWPGPDRSTRYPPTRESLPTLASRTGKCGKRCRGRARSIHHAGRALPDRGGLMRTRQDHRTHRSCP